jgi:hypothetical protein
LQTQNWVFVLFGCLAAAVLALAVDPDCWRLIESGLRHRSRLRTVLGGAGIAALVAAYAGTHRDPRAEQLRRRRKDLHRTICAVGLDCAAARKRPRFQRRRAKASAPA